MYRGAATCIRSTGEAVDAVLWWLHFIIDGLSGHAAVGPASRVGTCAARPLKIVAGERAAGPCQ